MPAPEENDGALYEHLLRRNERLVGAHFAIGIEDAVFLRGELAVAALNEAELDRVIGTLYATSSRASRPCCASASPAASPDAAPACPGRRQRSSDIPEAHPTRALPWGCPVDRRRRNVGNARDPAAYGAGHGADELVIVGRREHGRGARRRVARRRRASRRPRRRRGAAGAAPRAGRPVPRRRGRRPRPGRARRGDRRQAAATSPAPSAAAVAAGARRVLSIAAGVSIAAHGGGAPGAGVAVVRAMPNTPALVGQGASAIAGGTSADRRRPGLGRADPRRRRHRRAGRRAPARRRHRARRLRSGVPVPRRRGAHRRRRAAGLPRPLAER